jgi:hypothetical protein
VQPQQQPKQPPQGELRPQPKPPRQLLLLPVMLPAAVAAMQAAARRLRNPQAGGVVLLVVGAVGGAEAGRGRLWSRTAEQQGRRIMCKRRQHCQQAAWRLQAKPNLVVWLASGAEAVLGQVRPLDLLIMMQDTGYRRCTAALCDQ